MTNTNKVPVGRRRFLQLFLRQFAVLLLVSLGLLMALSLSHNLAAQTEATWIKFGCLDVVALSAASALTAWLKMKQDERRNQFRRDRV